MAKCFVIGPIGEVGTAVRADADDFMKYIVTPVVTSKDFGYEPPIRADNLNDPGRITSQIIKLLMDADLVIADLTGNNANVFYELSLRHAVGKPVVHMALEGTRLSFDVRDNRTIFYTMHSRVAELARSELAKQISHVRKPEYKPMNPILETAAILKLEGSSVPEQAALGQVLERIEELNLNVSDIRQQMRTELVRSNNLVANTVNALRDGPRYTGLLSEGVVSSSALNVLGSTGPTGVAGVAGATNALTGGLAATNPIYRPATPQPPKKG
jgi:hypothetical protein